MNSEFIAAEGTRVLVIYNECYVQDPLLCALLLSVLILAYPLKYLLGSISRNLSVLFITFYLCFAILIANSSYITLFQLSLLFSISLTKI